MTIHTIEVTSFDLETAYGRWLTYHEITGTPTSHDAFMDYIDPVRQAAFRVNSDTVLTPSLVAKRVAQLNSPHWYALMKANADKVEHAHLSWGKHYIRGSKK